MEAKDTVMSEAEFQEWIDTKKYSDVAFFSDAELNRQAQAEISFKAGYDQAVADSVPIAVPIIQESRTEARQAGIREEQKRMTKALRELHQKGWSLADVIEAEDTCGED